MKPLIKYFIRSAAAAMLFTMLCAAGSTAQNLIVKTNKGYIRGIQENEAFVFKGVPYAQPPVGALRFKAPQPHNPWKDTLSCVNFGRIASQYNEDTKALKGGEDCLSLNIYTPVTGAKAKMPVVVWVHGGSLTAGAGLGKDGHAFADHDHIVAITINYRLGVFGFMYMGDAGPSLHTSGNNGLLDLIMALQWVHENIASFGGDPSKVTVMGESAGAKLSSALLLAPKASGLFSQLVLESGGVQCVRDSITARAIRQRVMDELRITQPAQLLNLSAEQLIAAQGRICHGVAGTNYFGPVDDGVIISGDPYRYIARKKNKGIRILIGTNKRESKLFMDLDRRLYHPDSVVLKDWFGDNFIYSLAAYQAESKKTGPDSAAVSVLTQYMYQMHAYRLAAALANAGNGLWLYRFDYSEDGKGATHGDEPPYVWYLPKGTHPGGFNTDLAMQMHTAWVNFIKGDRPGKINHADWPPYPGIVHSVMIFNNDSGPAVLKQIFNDPAHPSGSLVLH